MIRALTLLALGATAQAATLVKSTKAQPVLKLRGGLGGVDAGMVAKVGAGLTLANGAYCGLAPKPASEAYGLADADFNIIQMIKSLGYTCVSLALLAFLVINGTPVGTAIAWAQVPWIVLGLDNVWNGTAEQMGQPAFAPLLLLAINAATAYCGFTDTAMPLAAQ